jgi:hypothetical protein
VPAAEELALHALLSRKLGRGRSGGGERFAVGVLGRVEAPGQPSIGVGPLSLSGVAPEPPRGDNERGREKQERGNEPGPAGPEAYFAPPRSPFC